MARRNQCKKLWILLPSELLVFIGESLVNPNVKNHDLVLGSGSFLWRYINNFKQWKTPLTVIRFATTNLQDVFHLFMVCVIFTGNPTVTMN